MLVSRRDVGESVGRMGAVWPLKKRCQRDKGLEGADDPEEFDGCRDNLDSDEGETTTGPVVADVARPPAGAYFSKCGLHFTQILLYKDATNSKNTVNRSHLSIKQNTYISLHTPGFASVHELNPDAAFVAGAAKRNLVGLCAAETR